METIVWYVKRYGISCAFSVFALWILVFDTQVTAQSHTETYATYRVATKQVCSSSSRQACSGWWLSNSCHTEYYCVYQTVTVAESVTSTRCQSGWSPYPSCNVTNECTQGISGCEQICNDTVASYICSCYAGYRLASNGRSCNDIDECTEKTSKCSQICNNTGGSYTCGCFSGYVLSLDRRNCTYVPKCPIASCQQTCTEINSSYVCGCYSGYKLSSDRRSCNDTDECAEGTSGCAVLCNNTIGSYTCGCNSGYTLASDLHMCQDIDECQRTSNCSQRCNNTIGSYVCDCDSGYALASDKRSCQDIDECIARLDDCNLLQNLTCQNTVGGFQCVCKSGFEQVGPRQCLGERPGFPNQDASNWLTLETVKGIIVVTVIVAVGVALVIMAVVCLVVCAKKRRQHKDTKMNNAEMATESGCDNVASAAIPTSSESGDSLNTSASDLVESENFYDTLADEPEEQTNTNTSVGFNETTNGKSISTNASKSVKGFFKSQKKIKELKPDKPPTDPDYQDLIAATNITTVYDSIIRQPSDSIVLSVSGEADNDSSHA